MTYLYEVCKEEDFEPFFQLKSQKDAVKWSGFATAPGREPFFEYFKTKILGNPKTHVFFLKETDEDDAVIGYRQYDEIDDTHIAVRGTTIFRKYQGCGYNEIFSQLLREYYISRGYKNLITYISEKNRASIYNAKMMGYVKTDEFEEVYFPTMNETHRMYKWVTDIK